MHTERKPRTALWAIGGFAIAGLLHSGAGFYWSDARLTVLGAFAIVLALVLGLATEAFRARRVKSAPAVPVTTGPPRKVEFEYVDQIDATPGDPASPAQIWNPTGMRPAAAGAGMSLASHEEDLIEFQLVDEPQAPTKLVVPPAFGRASRTEPPAPMTREIAMSTGAAVQRRKEIVSGLPLLTSILADETPAASQVQTPTPGKTRGQCSACGTMLWAPAQRPIRLRCPRCAHVRTLTE